MRKLGWILVFSLLAGCAHSALPPSAPEQAAQGRTSDLWQRGATPTYWVRLPQPGGYGDPPIVYSWPVNDNGVVAFGKTCCASAGAPPAAAIYGINYSGSYVPLSNVNPPQGHETGVFIQPIKLFPCADKTQICSAGDDYTLYGPNRTGYYLPGLYAVDATAGPGTVVWFTATGRANYIVRAENGTTRRFSIKSINDTLKDIALTGDGNVWVTLQKYGTSRWIFGRLNPSNAAFTEYPLALPSSPNQLLVGQDGNIWFALGHTLYRLVPATAQVTRYALPHTTNGYLAVGSGNTLWTGYVDSESAQGLIETNTSGTIVGDFACPATTCQASSEGFPVNTIQQLTLGPDRNIWFVYSNTGIWDVNQISNPREGINVYVVQAMHVSPQTVTFTAPGQTATITFSEEHYSGTFSAASTGTSIVRVVKFLNPNSVQIQAVSKGTARIIIRDTMNNYYGVTVTVG